MTCLVAETEELAQARRLVFLALLIAVAVTVHTVESLLPTPVPWLRLGLSNVITVIALYLYGGRAAWSVSLMRVGLGALLLGRLFSPGFWLALSGCLVATSAMVLLYRWAGPRMSPIGISAAGAAGHAFGQILAARLLVVQHAAIWQIFPLFLLFTIGSGVLTGWVAAMVLEQIAKHPIFQKGKIEKVCDETP